MPILKSKNKGKARVSSLSESSEPSETSPLLGQPSLSTHDPITHSSHTFRLILNTLAVIFLSLLLSFILFIVLLGASFRPSKNELSSLPHTAFTYSSPETIQVLNITESGVLVNITVRCGIDADKALGIISSSDLESKIEARERGDKGGGADWWEDLRRWTAHRLLQDINIININSPSDILLLSRQPHSPALFSISLPRPIEVPLVIGVKKDTPMKEWTKEVTVLAIARPIASTGELWDYVQSSWETGVARVTIGVEKVQVGLPQDGTWWGKWVKGDKEDLVLEVDIPIPQIPGLPWPGKPLNLSSLVNLKEYSLDTSPSALQIHGTASIPNLVPSLNATIPFNLPFSISLPHHNSSLETIMATVITSPIHLPSNTSDEITLHISGLISPFLAPLPSPNTTIPSPLSLFLQRYLHGLPNPIIVRGLSSLPTITSHPSPPAWLLNSLPALRLPLSFPGPQPPPKVIQSVAIENMRLSESGGKMRASGTVIAIIELPPGMEKVLLEVHQVKPDVLIFDGPAPDELSSPLISVSSKNNHKEEDYPEGAFGYIHPDQYLDATSEQSDGKVTVRAPLDNVELVILPGRDKQLSDFVGKVVFKGGALAGIKGDAAVQVRMHGVVGTVSLEKLPVKGETWVGRQKGRRRKTEV
ncbi:hypothetical protein TREMEDRAFT_26565 [Tremella mesenterica DSM 1558]|uniref:uncharacterized protein n=1 Tax=Tremella mesenterica (strain ATCC 24925 / CBS 8224 / DSM 1558 / NBRC 9311 / NRRL Y-6157 / RJB 2259-6 / UBC 559-6) TaxID=578456 RepID=UPI0003F49F3D|nr:uncharacterized protein TREMEDRAFT_26565 [Tremella mesenterica DSM 1558]EIW73155.1 hypothetical protein TREMEDRAFT_26565 [Tremella mesenterica DSM 1558]